MRFRTIAVIPAYEPDERMLTLLEEAADAFDERIVIDDGSGEAFAPLFAKAAQYAHLITYPENHGKGYAVKTALRYIAENSSPDSVIVIMDCDGQHTVKDGLRLLEAAENDPEALLLGSRKQSVHSPLRSRVGNAITRTVFALTARQRVYDTQTGLRAFHTSLIDELLEVEGDRYEYEMNVLMQFARNNIRLVELPIETIYFDNNKGSHFNALWDSIRIYIDILKFSASSFLSFCVDFLAYSLLILCIGDAYAAVCNIAARIISATVNFSLNQCFVFKGRGKLLKNALKYATTAVVILLINTLLLHLLTMLNMNALVAKLIVEVLLFAGSFLVQRTLVFKRSKDD